MKILIVTPIFPPEIGGPATYTAGLVETLRAKHNLSIICFSSQEPTAISGIKIRALTTTGTTVSRQASLIYGLVKEARKTDLLYVQGSVVVGISSVVIAVLFAKPSVLKFVGDEVWEERRRRGSYAEDIHVYLEKRGSDDLQTAFWRVIQKISLKLASRIVVPSEYLRDLLIRYYKIRASKIEVIPNPVLISRGIRKFPRRGSLILSSGRLVPQKRFDTLIKAFARLVGNQQLKGVKLMIVGDGPEKNRLKNLIERTGLVEYVELPGSQARREYLSLLASASIFVLTSEYEGLSHAIIEAMLLGVPVVATDIPGNRELVRHQQTGLLVTGVAGAIAEAMQRLLRDRQLAERLSRNARHQATKKFTWKSHNQRLIHLFRQELTQSS